MIIRRDTKSNVTVVTLQADEKRCLIRAAAICNDLGDEGFEAGNILSTDLKGLVAEVDEAAANAKKKPAGETPQEPKAK